jgi:hypothetical protein
MKLPDPGLYRTTKPYPGHEETIPGEALVYVGTKQNGGLPFVVRPGANRNNRWYWGEPTVPLRAMGWANTLVRLPSEGFYTLPEEIRFDGGGRWLKHAVVQLGYNAEGRGIIFVAEQHDGEERNILVFSDRGRLIDDGLLNRLAWAPILPIRSDQPANES